MGRNSSLSTPEDFEKAVAYLRRKIERADTSFFVKPSQATTELARIEALLSRLPADDAPGVFSSWLVSYLTKDGRVKTLNALRRKRADANPGRLRRRVISVSPAVYKELERLSLVTGGIPMPKLLESLAAIANVDKSLQKKLFTVAVAI